MNNEKIPEQSAENGADSGQSYGKFPSARELLKAYNSLESEFTKRCQKLKELEENSAKFDSSLQDLDACIEKVLADDDFIERRILGDEHIVNKIIYEYLSKLSNVKSAPTLSSISGKSALTPLAKPKNLEEARRLAEILFRT